MQEVAPSISEYQLERGKPMPSLLHSRVQTRLAVLLAKLEPKYMCFSELSLALNEWESVPDLSLYSKSDIDTSQDEAKVTRPPLCAIEILSASQTLDSLVDKTQKYFEHGVKSCWIVIPRLKSIYVFENATTYEVYRDHQVLMDKQLGIEVLLGEVFR
jgi:Uma2 family endonuclease